MLRILQMTLMPVYIDSRTPLRLAPLLDTLVVDLVVVVLAHFVDARSKSFVQCVNET